MPALRQAQCEQADRRAKQPGVGVNRASDERANDDADRKSDKGDDQACRQGWLVKQRRRKVRIGRHVKHPPREPEGGEAGDATRRQQQSVRLKQAVCAVPRRLVSAGLTWLTIAS